MKKPKDLIDELLAGCKTPADIAGENGLLKQLTKAIIERAMQAELTTHLGYEKHSVEGHNTGNSRNGTSGKRLKGDFGTLEIAVPGTGSRASSRSWWPRARRAGMDSMTRFCLCMRAA